MTIDQIFDLAIKMGTNADLRGRAAVRKMLKRKKEQYEQLTKEQKAEFDTEALTNPYLDSRIHFVAKGAKGIKKVLVGIDMEGDEVLLAKQLGDIDLIIAHHPRGKALTNLHDVMHLQADVLAQYGVPINVAEGVQREKISEVARGINPINHYRP
ncbi:MAG: NGG1p interacting factor NIF3, partial [Candidatus Parcubacteria bacterium]|nr:NGG1p interacting factor NIF3 [Candidatus Parcubacteria bacterium]